MRKYLGIIIILVLAGVSSQAQNKTTIGAAHSVNLGAYYGFGSNGLGNHAGFNIDFNALNSNIRTRLSFEAEQFKDGFCPALSIDFLKMIKLNELLYFYPLGGVQFANYNDDSWPCRFDIAPEAGAGLEFQFSKNFAWFIQGKFKYGILGTGPCVLGQSGFSFAFGEGKRVKHQISVSGADLANALRAKDEADDIRYQEALKQAQAEKAKAAADAKAKALAEKKAHDVATRKAFDERLLAEIAAAEEKAKKAALKPVHEDIFFGKHSSVLDDNALVQIDDIVTALVRDPDAKVTLKGYADKSEGSEKSCLNYAKNRLDSIVEALAQKGIDVSRIISDAIGSAVAPYEMPESNRVVTVDTHH